MKPFHAKSFVAGLIIGTMGITTAFAATGIASAALSGTQISLNGASLSLDRPLISVTMEGEQEASLYVPATETFTNLGYAVNYDSAKNTLDLIPHSTISHETVDGSLPQEGTVISLANHPDQRNIAESGSFQAEDHQTLTLTITSDIKGGSVDFFLFDPNGKEQRITIGSADITKEIPLEKGIWQYNCSGLFQDGGNITVIGTIQ